MSIGFGVYGTEAGLERNLNGCLGETDFKEKIDCSFVNSNLVRSSGSGYLIKVVNELSDGYGFRYFFSLYKGARTHSTGRSGCIGTTVVLENNLPDVHSMVDFFAKTLLSEVEKLLGIDGRFKEYKNNWSDIELPPPSHEEVAKNLLRQNELNIVHFDTRESLVLKVPDVYTSSFDALELLQNDFLCGRFQEIFIVDDSFLFEKLKEDSKNPNGKTFKTNRVVFSESVIDLHKLFEEQCYPMLKEQLNREITAEYDRREQESKAKYENEKTELKKQLMAEASQRREADDKLEEVKKRYEQELNLKERYRNERNAARDEMDELRKSQDPACNNYHEINVELQRLLTSNEEDIKLADAIDRSGLADNLNMVIRELKKKVKNTKRGGSDSHEKNTFKESLLFLIAGITVGILVSAIYIHLNKDTEQTSDPASDQNVEDISAEEGDSKKETELRELLKLLKDKLGLKASINQDKLKSLIQKIDDPDKKQEFEKKWKDLLNQLDGFSNDEMPKKEYYDWIHVLIHYTDNENWYIDNVDKFTVNNSLSKKDYSNKEPAFKDGEWTYFIEENVMIRMNSNAIYTRELKQ